jgi:deazaflavin-dependent oxidoreductase (nitroreductase family)
MENERTMSASVHYRRPGWFTRNVFNRSVALLTRAGVSVWGSRVLEVRGRRSGLPRRTPVNLLAYEGGRYLVSPRGEGEWVRNLRADQGRLSLLLGRRREELVASELPDERKPPVLRAYLRRWKAEVGMFFDGVDADSSDAALERIAPSHPVFVLGDPERRDASS